MCKILTNNYSLRAKMGFFPPQQPQAIRGPLSEGISTIVSTASTTSITGKMSPSTFVISSDQEGDTK